MTRNTPTSETNVTMPELTDLDSAPLGPPSPPSPPVPTSDRRLKRDINALTVLADGTKLYSFRYLWSETVYVGVMAQDLLADPERADAVLKQANGYYAVDYHRLGLQMATIEDWNTLGFEAVTAPVASLDTAGSRAA